MGSPEGHLGLGNDGIDDSQMDLRVFPSLSLFRQSHVMPSISPKWQIGPQNAETKMTDYDQPAIFDHFSHFFMGPGPSAKNV